MKLNVLSILTMYNHYISMAIALGEVLEAHGIEMDQGRCLAHLSIGELFSERDDAEVESHLALLREAAGIDGPEPVPGEGYTEQRKAWDAAKAKPKAEPKPKEKPKTKRTPRNLTPEARERIAAAQRKRWEAFRAENKPNDNVTVDKNRPS